MLARRFRSLARGLCLGSVLAGCADEPGARRELDPAADPPPAPGIHLEPLPSEPVACSRALPAANVTWKLHEGPPQTVRRQVAATSGASFVVSDRVVKRRLHGADGFETVHGVPGRYFLQTAASADRLFVVSEAGVFTSDDDGATFTEGDAGLEGNITALRASASTVMMTSSQGYVARWDEAGGAWVPLDTGGAPVMLAASDGATTLADTGVAVIRSQEAGAWSPVLGLEEWGYRDLVVAGTESVAVTIFGELRASTDAGATFALSDPTTAQFGPATRVATSGDAFVATTTAGVIRSTDGGTTWSMVAPVSTSDNLGSIAAFGDSVVVATPAVRTSDDGGATFSRPIALRDQSIVSIADVGPWRFVSTADRMIHASYGGGSTLWQTLDPPGIVVADAAYEGDDTWLLLAPRIPGERHVGGDALVVSPDGGDSWQEVALPFGAVYAAHAFLEVDGGSVLVATTVDNRYGDPYAAAPVGSGLYRTDDGGAHWTPTNIGLPSVEMPDGQLAYPTVTAMGSHDETVMIMLGGIVPHQSTDFGDSWQAIGDGLEPGAALDRLFASDHGFFAASSAGAELYVLAPGQGAWSRLAASGLPDGWRALSIAEDGGLLFLGIEAGGTAELYVSADGGASFVSSGLGAAATTLHIEGERLTVGSHGDGLFSLELSACE